MTGAILFWAAACYVAASLLVTPARAQQPPIEQTVRRVVNGLSEAQILVLQISDLVEQNTKLKKENEELKAKLNPPPDEKK